MNDIQITQNKIIISDISKYSITFKDNNLILECKDDYLSEKDFLNKI